MYSSNPLLEAFFVDSAPKIFHKGQIKQKAYSLKMSNRTKENIEKDLSSTDENISKIKENIASCVASGKSRNIKPLLNQLKVLNKQHDHLKKRHKHICNVIDVNKKQLKRMNQTNKKFSNEEL